jgi:hypothetical protein
MRCPRPVRTHRIKSRLRADSSADIRDRQAFSSMFRETVYAAFSCVNHALFSKETLDNSERILISITNTAETTLPKPDDDIFSTIPVVSEFTQENNEKGGKRQKSQIEPSWFD